VLKRSGKMDVEPGSTRFGLRQANSTVQRKQGVRLGEGAVVGGLNSSGSAVHARASLIRRPHLQAGDQVVKRRDGFGLSHGRPPVPSPPATPSPPFLLPFFPL
jgi:hypothetical protein